MRRLIQAFIEKAKAHPKATAIVALLSPVLMVGGVNVWMVNSTAARVFNDANALPENDVGLVLGAGRTMSGGAINPHFKARIEAAAYLYRAGKVKHLLVSGDNHHQGYDEPTDMQEALIKLGVPEAAITRDYAGFRTLDSIVRAKEVFGLNKLTMITDDFHVNRALFLARHYDIDALAFACKAVSYELSANARWREVGARVKAAMDVYVLRTEPRFLGERVEIRVAEKS